jgi:hypothetical protein
MLLADSCRHGAMQSADRWHLFSQCMQCGLDRSRRHGAASMLSALILFQSQKAIHINEKTNTKLNAHVTCTHAHTHTHTHFCMHQDRAHKSINCP